MVEESKKVDRKLYLLTDTEMSSVRDKIFEAVGQKPYFESCRITKASQGADSPGGYHYAPEGTEQLVLVAALIDGHSSIQHCMANPTLFQRFYEAMGVTRAEELIGKTIDAYLVHPKEGNDFICGIAVPGK